MGLDGLTRCIVRCVGVRTATFLIPFHNVTCIYIHVVCITSTLVVRRRVLYNTVRAKSFFGSDVTVKWGI